MFVCTVCDSLCVFVFVNLHDRPLKPKRLKSKSPNLAHGTSRVFAHRLILGQKGQRSRSQGHINAKRRSSGWRDTLYHHHHHITFVARWYTYKTNKNNDRKQIDVKTCPTSSTYEMNTKILTHSVELSQAEVYNRILAMEVFHSNHVEIPCPTAPLHKPQLRPTPRSAALSTGFAEVAKRIHKSSKRSTYKQLYIKENCTRNVKLSLCIWPAHVGLTHETKLLPRPTATQGMYRRGLQLDVLKP